jgi:hypothetical protein
MHESVIDKSEGSQDSEESQVHIKLLRPMETRSHAARNSILAWGVEVHVSNACVRRSVAN